MEIHVPKRKVFSLSLQNTLPRQAGIMRAGQLNKPTTNMKLKSRSLVIAAVAVAGISAQAATYNGDLLLGFTTQNGKDLIYDIGPASSLFPGQTWNLSSSLLGAGISALGGAKWGVIGDKNVAGQRYAWTTTAGFVPSTIPNTPFWGTLDT